MALQRVTARWTGFTGAPGYTNFFFSDAVVGGDVDDNVARVQAAFGQWIRALPDSVSVQIDADVAVIEPASGQITDYVNPTTPPPRQVGLDAAGYSGATGAVVNWNTNTVRNGRRLRGRTFLVPLAGDSYDDTGSLSTAAIGIIRDGANQLVGGAFDSTFAVWGRPTNSAPGVVGEVISHTVPDLAAVLRSRRD